jgi:hypothetical protein
MRVASSILSWAALILIACPATARAEWQIRPSLAVNLGQDTTFFVSDAGAKPTKLSFGVAGALIGDVLGLEADFGRRSGFLPAKGDGTSNVLASSVTTLTGNVTVALPRRLTEYTLRPYVAGGAGVMFVRIDETVNLFDASSTINTMDFGGGVTGFLTKRVGLNWDVRRFLNVGDEAILPGITTGPPEVSFWRATMALAIRY